MKFTSTTITSTITITINIKLKKKKKVKNKNSVRKKNQNSQKENNYQCFKETVCRYYTARKYYVKILHMARNDREFLGNGARLLKQKELLKEALSSYNIVNLSSYFQT